MNIFRMSDGTLDRQYLRVCAVWRLLKSGRIDFNRAKEIADIRVNGVRFRNTVEIWEGSKLAREALNQFN